MSENEIDPYNVHFEGGKLDPYRIGELFGITNPALFQILKKVLRSGRKHKNLEKDVEDIRTSAVRWQEMRAEDAPRETVACNYCGTKHLLSLSIDGVCPTCYKHIEGPPGILMAPPPQAKDCLFCNGQGFIGIFRCPPCSGTGKHHEQPAPVCQKCKGTRKVLAGMLPGDYFIDCPDCQ